MNIGPYRLISKLGSGGFAEVYLGIKKGADGFEKKIAIKKILNVHSTDSKMIQMLRDEARLQALLDHPNLVQIYSFDEIGDEKLLILEFVDGGTLRKLLDKAIAKKIEIPWQIAVYILTEVLKGLSHLHTLKTNDGVDLGVIHRDIDPNNILLRKDGLVKVSDFGIATSNVREGQTEVGQVKGKIPYMSPEQIEAKTLDQRSDIYTCGVVLYEILTQKNRVEGLIPVEQAQRVRTGDFPPVQYYRADLPIPLVQISSKALSLERGHRFETADEFRSALMDIQYPHFLSAGDQALKSLLEEIYAGEPMLTQTEISDKALAATVANSQLVQENVNSNVSSNLSRNIIFVVMAIGVAIYWINQNRSNAVILPEKVENQSSYPIVQPTPTIVPTLNATNPTVPVRKGHLVVDIDSRGLVFLNGVKLRVEKEKSIAIDSGSYDLLMILDGTRKRVPIRVYSNKTTRIVFSKINLK